MKLYEIISNMKFVGIKNYKDVDIDALTCDSKEIVNNGIYFCIKGMNFDGHDFAEESLSNGAVCLVVEKYLNLPVPQICVNNVRVAMSYISSIFFETYKSNMKFVGITGTNGKTTTTYIIKEILSKMGKSVGLIGTEGIHINKLSLPAMLTTPDPIALHKVIREMESNGCEYCVMEVSAHAIALNKIDNIFYDVVALTNITKDHLDFFHTMENYAKAKQSLFDYKHAKSGVVNIDAKYGKETMKKSSIEVLSVGKDARVSIVGQIYSLKGTQFKIKINDKIYLGNTNLIGEYNLYNLITAISCLINLGFEISTLLDVVKDCEFFVPGRLNILNTDTDYKVVIDYAHTPDGIKNVLSAIKSLNKGKGNIITVFGCGGNRDKTKRSEMGSVAVNLSDQVIVTSDNPRNENPDMIIDDITKNLNGLDYLRIVDRKEAIEYALSIAEANDIIAILGKGAETYQEINGIKYHFSDYEVVDEYLYKIKEDKLKAW